MELWSKFSCSFAINDRHLCVSVFLFCAPSPTVTRRHVQFFLSRVFPSPIPLFTLDNSPWHNRLDTILHTLHTSHSVIHRPIPTSISRVPSTSHPPMGSKCAIISEIITSIAAVEIPALIFSALPWMATKTVAAQTAPTTDSS